MQQFVRERVKSSELNRSRSQPPSSVNNCAREMMRAIRVQWENAAWFDFGLTVTLKAQNKIRVASSSYTASDVYPVDSRIKVISNNATLYGTVVTLSSSSSAVIVQANFDSGTATSTITTVFRSIITPNNSPVPELARSFRTNFIINSGFTVTQRGTTFTSATTPANNDDTYTFDRWLLLSDGNDIVDLSRATPGGYFSEYFCKFTQATANKQWGLVQVVESNSSVPLRNIPLNLTFTAYKDAGNSTAETLRAAIVYWDGTVNSVTSDLVGTWNGAGTNPTLATNWTYLTTPSSITLTSTATVYNFRINNSGGSANNIAVFFWLDDTDATVGDIINIGNISLTASEIAPVTSGVPLTSTWEYRQPKSIAEETLNCQRYYYKSTSTNTPFIYTSAVVSSSGIYTAYHVPSTMRTAPTVSASSSGALDIYDNTNTAATSSFIAFTGIGVDSARIGANRTGAGLTAGDASSVGIRSGEYIEFDAEM